MMKHGESIVDLMGGEIDRIEMKLRVFAYINSLNCILFLLLLLFLQKNHPEIRHCDLEIL